MSPGRARTPAGQRPPDVILRDREPPSAAARGLGEGRARAGRGCPTVPPVLRRLRAGAAEPEPWFQLPAPCPSRPAAPLSTALQAGQGRAGQAPGALAWWFPLTGSCSLSLCSRRERRQHQQEEEGAALALCSAPELGRCPGARAGGLRLQQGALWAAPGSPLRRGRHAAPAHPGRPAWTGGPQPSLWLLQSHCPQRLRGWLGHWALHPRPPLLAPDPLRVGGGAQPGAELWPLPSLVSSAKQLSSCVSRRSSWTSCTREDRRRRGYSGDPTGGQRSRS